MGFLIQPPNGLPLFSKSSLTKFDHLECACMPESPELCCEAVACPHKGAQVVGRCVFVLLVVGRGWAGGRGGEEVFAAGFLFLSSDSSPMSHRPHPQAPKQSCSLSEKAAEESKTERK